MFVVLVYRILNVCICVEYNYEWNEVFRNDEKFFEIFEIVFFVN